MWWITNFDVVCLYLFILQMKLLYLLFISKTRRIIFRIHSKNNLFYDVNQGEYMLKKPIHVFQKGEIEGQILLVFLRASQT